MLLVYTHKITPRLTYAFKHICTRILGIPVKFTTTIEDFITHDSMKMSYAKQPLSNEVFVRSNELLFEIGLSDIDINVHDWDDTKCFFNTSEKSSLPYDIFAASFYLLSRYEEYLPHVKDEYGRFLASESLALKNKFLHQPVIDIWAYKFKAILQAQFPDYNFPQKLYSIQPVIDVPMAYYFKQKGVMRTIGGTFNDLLELKIRRLFQRYLTIFGFRRDPYDTFKWIINKQKQTKTKFIVFFLIGDYSTFDKNINVNKKRFISLIKSVSDYCKVGLKASFFALEDINILKKEKLKLESITNYELEASRHSFSKLNIPESYRNLVELEVKQDFTMGYINHTGFRAGTCTPFQFYDLDYEVQTPLQINSFHCIDYAFLKKHSLLDKRQELEQLIYEVKKVNGTFTPIFHNYTFGDEDRWKGFKKLFTLILDSAHENK
ncbi:polysaccharide deacetylase family protein [Aquaticitalea lipolytica]|uniref:polysaccharide deacetylase family protein n=1 Tax=Aquaticitalea lipolytica TaxID=1247562 RepID=UPI0024BB3147|nr:polysaccharide deacetylase family protein [Aquaticitalea lipolytica]